MADKKNQKNWAYSGRVSILVTQLDFLTGAPVLFFVTPYICVIANMGESHPAMPWQQYKQKYSSTLYNWIWLLTTYQKIMRMDIGQIKYKIINQIIFLSFSEPGHPWQLHFKMFQTPAKVFSLSSSSGISGDCIQMFRRPAMEVFITQSLVQRPSLFCTRSMATGSVFVLVYLYL